MSSYVFWIIICSIICVTLVMLASIISNAESENNEKISDEQLERAGDIFAKAICKNIFEQENKNGQS